MKTIGMLGGMSWESTATYYKLLNQFTAQRLGGLHSAQIILHSVNFAPVEAMLKTQNWQGISQKLCAAANGLQEAGAQCIILCTNTMHKLAPEIQQCTGLPFLHIADATSDALKAKGVDTVALLGTKFTMEQDFYKNKLWEQGFEVLLPDDWQMAEIDRIIFEELCRGKVTQESKTFFIALIDNLHQQGAQGVILGCTEIGMAVSQKDSKIPLFDTTYIHAKKAVDFALE